MNRPAIYAVAAGALLSAVLTYPTIIDPASRARIDTGDGRFSVWNVAWVAHALVDEPRALFDANIFHPHRGTLAFSEANLVAGLMGAPVYAMTRHPIVTHNVVVYLAHVLAFVAMWALVRRLTGASAPALVSAAAFTFAPFVAARSAHIQLLMVFVFPVSLLALHRFVDAPGLRRGAVLGLALALAGLACGYYGVYAGLAVGLGAVWFVARHSQLRQYGIGLVVAAIVAAAIVGPVLRPYLVLRQEAGARRQTDPAELRGYSATLRAYFNSPARSHRWLTGQHGDRQREVLFPGVIVTVLAAAAFVRRRTNDGGSSSSAGADTRTRAFYAALAVLAAWASFGPDGGLYSVLDAAVPFMSFLRAPARAGVVVVFALAVLAGFGVVRLTKVRQRTAASLLLLALVVAEVNSVPWPLRPVPPVPDAYARLAELPPGPVVDFHFAYRRGELFPHTRAMFWSTWHWRPLVNGYSDFTPPDFFDIAVPINGFPDQASFRILEDRQVRYVVLWLGDYSPEGQAILSARFTKYAEFLRPIVATGDVRLWEIVRYPSVR